MQQVLHIERVNVTPYTPTSSLDGESRAPETPSRKRFSFSAWTAPLKSLRSRRKVTVSTDQSPTIAKHTPSRFNLFHGTRSRALGGTEALKDGIGPRMSSPISPSKNGRRGDPYTTSRPKRSKSFGDLLGTISVRVASKYNTVSGRNAKFDITDFESQTKRIIGSPKNGNLDLASALQNGEEPIDLPLQVWRERIRIIESEMNAFWELEEAIEDFKHNQTADLLGFIKDNASSCSTWAGSDKTLYNFEDEVLDRATPKSQGENRGACILPNIHSDLVASSPQNLATESFAIQDSHKLDYAPVYSHPYERGSGYVQLPSFKEALNATVDFTIAERIQLTADEMTRTRHMNPSMSFTDSKSIERHADLSGAGPPPYTVVTDPSSMTTVLCSTSRTQTPTVLVDTTTMPDQGPTINSGILCPKSIIENTSVQQSLGDARQVSKAPVRVAFPETSTEPSQVGIYASITEAISGLFERNTGELSNVCAYDRENRVIKAYRLGSAPNASEVLCRGLEFIWLPLEDMKETEAVFDRMLSDELLDLKDPQYRHASTSSRLASGYIHAPPPMTNPVVTKKPSIVGHKKSESNALPKFQCPSPIPQLTPNYNYFRGDLESENESFSNTSRDAPSNFSELLKEHDESAVDDLRSSLSEGSSQLSMSEQLPRETNIKRLLKRCEINEWRKIGPLKDYLRNTPLSQWPYYVERVNTTSDTQLNPEPNLKSEKPNKDFLCFASYDKDDLMDSVQQDDPLFPDVLSRQNVAELNLEVPLANGFPFTAYAAELLETGGQHKTSAYVNAASNYGADRSMSPRPSLRPISPGNNCAGQTNALLMTRFDSAMHTSPTSNDAGCSRSNFDAAGGNSGGFCSNRCLGTGLQLVPEELSKVTTRERIQAQIVVPSTSRKSSCTCVNEFLTPVASNEGTKVAGLVEIFQARGMIRPGLISAMQRPPKLSDSIDSSVGQKLSSSNDLVNKLGTVSNTRVTTSSPTCGPFLDQDPPTTRSLATTPDHNLSDDSTEISSLFGEQLHRFERAGPGSREDEGPVRNRDVFRDSLIYG